VNPYNYENGISEVKLSLKEETPKLLHYEIQFRSALNTGYPENSVLKGEYYWPRVERKTPLAILVHGMRDHSPDWDMLLGDQPHSGSRKAVIIFRHRQSSTTRQIDDIGVIIDDEVAPRDDIQLILKGGQRVMLYDARTIQDIWCNIVEPRTVLVHKTGGLKPGKHELKIITAEQIAEYYEQPLSMIMGNIKATMRVAR
jgi:hypothetical protein